MPRLSSTDVPFPLGRETMSTGLESAANYHRWMYEWIAPYYRPWMNNIAFTYSPLIGAIALIAGYMRCRLASRAGKVSGLAEEMERENDLLAGIDEL